MYVGKNIDTFLSITCGSLLPLPIDNLYYMCPWIKCICVYANFLWHFCYLQYSALIEMVTILWRGYISTEMAQVGHNSSISLDHYMSEKQSYLCHTCKHTYLYTLDASYTGTIPFNKVLCNKHTSPVIRFLNNVLSNNTKIVSFLPPCAFIWVESSRSSGSRNNPW